MKNRKITIGRSTDCDIVLGDLTVSRLHAELELLENNRLLLTDCNSSQGSFVINGGKEERVSQRIVSELDSLKFGNITITVSEIVTATQLYESYTVDVNDDYRDGNPKEANRIHQAPVKSQCANSGSTESFSQLYFSFDGRITRSTYWLKFILPGTLISLLLAFVDISTSNFNYSIGLGTYSGLFAIVQLIPSWAMGTKRCHDRNRSWWFLLVGMIPLVNFWPIVELGFLRGTVGDNSYGSDPLLRKE